MKASKSLLFTFFALALLPLSLSAVPDFDFTARGGVPGHGDWELGFVRENSTTIDQAEWNWSSGEQVPFSLEYSASQNRLQMFWGFEGSEILETIEPDSLDGTIKVWAKTSVDMASISITDLTLSTELNPFVQGDDIFVEGENSLSEFVFDVPVQGNFLLSGNLFFNYQGSVPKRSRMQFHITNAENAVEVPEPGTMLLIGSGAAAAAYFKRRKEKKAS